MTTSDNLTGFPEPQCDCRRCIAERGDAVGGWPRLMCEMIVCKHCGDKRCVHAEDHEAPCAKVDIYAHNAWVERRYVTWRHSEKEIAATSVAIAALRTAGEQG